MVTEWTNDTSPGPKMGATSPKLPLANTSSTPYANNKRARGSRRYMCVNNQTNPSMGKPSATNLGSENSDCVRDSIQKSFDKFYKLLEMVMDEKCMTEYTTVNDQLDIEQNISPLCREQQLFEHA